MFGLRWWQMGVLAAAVGAAGVLPSQAMAYSGGCHEDLARQATEIFTFPELEDYEYALAGGAVCEDDIDHVYGCSSPFNTIPHFWIADEGDEQTNWWGAYEYPNAYMKARIMLQWAENFYCGSNKDSAYHYFGHVAHLLCDQGVPCHVHYDEHADDAYENWMGSGQCATISGDVAETVEGMPEVSDALVDWIISYFGVIRSPAEVQATLYYLMYTTNQRSDWFASDDVDGNSYERMGWVDYNDPEPWPTSPRVTGDLVDNDDGDNDNDGDLSRIMWKCFPYAMCATARLYEAWRDYFDDEPPTTSISVAGAEPVHDGWRPGGVEVTLTAEDDGYIPSGVYEIRYGPFNENCHLVYTTPVPVTNEGITEFYYRSMDRFANLEAANLELIKIDMTPPEVEIISPVADGLYLTDGSITIDFEATDARSGIWGVWANLDGVPVSDGQVLDDLENMAGFHTVTVTAEDFAGNTTTVSVEFSIKIHASVDLTPNPLSDKSAGASMLAEVEFPPEYDVSLIDVSRSILTANGEDVPAKLWPSTLGHYGPDGLLGRNMMFDRRLVIQALGGATGNITLTVSGWLTDPIEYWGTDVVEVFSAPRFSLRTTAGRPQELVIQPIGPNPLAEGAVVEFGLPGDGLAEIGLYDVQGRLVMSLARREYKSGYHTLEWNSDGALSPGLYFLRLQLGSDVATCKVVVSK